MPSDRDGVSLTAAIAIAAGLAAIACSLVHGMGWDGFILICGGIMVAYGCKEL